MKPLELPFFRNSLLVAAAALGADLCAQDPGLQEAVLAETAEGDAKKALALYTTLARADDRDLSRRAMLGQARLLRRLGRRDEAKALLEVLATEQGQGQDEAKRALGQGGEKGRIAELIDNARNSRAVDELIWIGQPAVPILIEEVRKRSKMAVISVTSSNVKLPRELSVPVFVLMQIGGDRVRTWLEEVVDKGGFAVQAAVVQAIRSSTDPKLRTVAARLIGSKDARMSRLATKEIGRLVSVDRLVRLLLGGQPSHRVDAAEVLNAGWSKFRDRDTAALAIVDAVDKGRLAKTNAVRALVAKIRDDDGLFRTSAGRTARLRAWLLQPATIKEFGYDTDTMVADENAEWLAKLGDQASVQLFHDYINQAVSNWTSKSADVVLHLVDEGLISGEPAVGYWVKKVDRKRLPELLRRMHRFHVLEGNEEWRALRNLLAQPLPGEIAALAEAGAKSRAGQSSRGMNSAATVGWLLAASDSAEAVEGLRMIASRSSGFATAVAEVCVRADRPKLLAACVPLLSRREVSQPTRSMVLRVLLQKRPTLLRGKTAEILPVGNVRSRSILSPSGQPMPTGLPEIVVEGLEANPDLFWPLLDNRTWPEVADVVYPFLLRREGTEESLRWVGSQPETPVRKDFISAAIRDPKWVGIVVEHWHGPARVGDIEPLMAYLDQHPRSAPRVAYSLSYIRGALSPSQLEALVGALEKFVVDGGGRDGSAELLARYDAGRAVALFTKTVGQWDDRVTLRAWKASSDPRFAPLLSRMQASSDDDIRKQAQEALAVLDAQEKRQREASRSRALRTLIEQAKKPGKAQMRAIRALGRLTAPEAALTLVELAGSDNEAAARLAEEVLSR